MIYIVQCNDGKSATRGRLCVRQHPSPASSEPLAGLSDSRPGTGMAWPAAQAGPGDGAASSRSYRGAPFCCLPASLAAAAPPRILTSGTPARSRNTPIRRGSPDAASHPHHTKPAVKSRRVLGKYLDLMMCGAREQASLGYKVIASITAHNPEPVCGGGNICRHQPRCPEWPAPDHLAARIVADQPGHCRRADLVTITP